jgi:hypothetical protein
MEYPDIPILGRSSDAWTTAKGNGYFQRVTMVATLADIDS